MKVAVIGAGIVGVSSAFELARDGHEVQVFERHAAVASGSSFANAGVLAPGYVTPWAAPGMSWKVLKHLFSRHAPVRFSGGAPFNNLGWAWRWWRACNRKVHAANRTAMVRMAKYSMQHRAALAQELKLEYELRTGYLVLLRTPRDLKAAQAGMQLLGELGVEHALVEPQRVHAMEPGLNRDTALQGAIHLPRDEVGNCRQFAHLLKAQAQVLGAQFRFHHQVQRVEAGPQPAVHWREAHEFGEGPSGSARFDAVVLCTGHLANELLQPLRLRLPMQAVHGYSITAPVRLDERFSDMGPRAALMDEKYKVAISRLGQRVRVAGSAEVGGAQGSMNQAAIATLYKVLNDWFPAAATLSQVQVWKGSRPMLADGPPVIGASPAAGIWFNLGHGGSGWAMANGSARALADTLGGRKPELDLSCLTPQRVLG